MCHSKIRLLPEMVFSVQSKYPHLEYRCIKIPIIVNDPETISTRFPTIYGHVLCVDPVIIVYILHIYIRCHK